MANIFVAVPINRPIEFRVFESFLTLANNNRKHNFTFGLTQNSLVYDAREHLTDLFLKSNCDAIMFIDSDMTFHPESIDYLYRHNVPYVCAKAFKRVEPYQPCFYTTVRQEANGEVYLESPIEYGEGLLRIEGSGMACTLIRREVFEKIEKPYFFPKNGLGEDLSFCIKLKESGIDMFVDTTLQFGHLAQIPIMESHFKAYYEANKHKNEKLYVDGDK